MKKLVVGVLLAACLGSATVRANELEHFGTAFALQTLGYGVAKKMFHIDNKLFALVFAGVMTVGMSGMAELDKPRPSGRTFSAAMYGLGLSSVSIVIFDF